MSGLSLDDVLLLAFELELEKSARIKTDFVTSVLERLSK